MGLFGDLNVRIDPWDAEYGGEVRIDASEITEDSADVDIEVELAASQWCPLPARGTSDRRLHFVDGVRRIDTRLLVTSENGLGHGAFGGYATGAVAVDDGEASFAEYRVGRVIVLGGGEIAEDVIDLGDGVVYRPISAKATDPEAPIRAILNEMRRAETELSARLAENTDNLVVRDGPLSLIDSGKGLALGFIKRLMRFHLPADKFGFLSSLPTSSRSPMFAFETAGVGRYSWYIRLSERLPSDSPITGIARLEVGQGIGFEAAAALADASAGLLPRFCPARGRDPRAPQNLLPIGALEQFLRRQMGNEAIIRRRIEARIAEEAAGD